MEHADVSLLTWLTFLGIVLTLLVLDLGVLHRKEREIGVRESLITSGVYILIALSYGGWIWHEFGADKGREYLTGYLLEETLSIDNLFIMSLIFGYFKIPRQYQHRVLFWGILGVIVMRGVLIFLGAALVERFEWVLYIFAAFLIFTGFKMLTSKGGEDPDAIAKSKILIWLKRYLPITETLHGNKFIVMMPHAQNPKRKVRYYTPLFLCLVLIEFTDLIFALDSIPAIFAVTTDPFIIYTSNIFAVVGLRALYFALAAIIHRFEYLKYALAAVLVFIGGKVIAAPLLGLEKIPPSISLGVTVTLLTLGVVVSLLKSRNQKPKDSELGK